MALGGLFAVLGHCFSLPFNIPLLFNVTLPALRALKGGKGVATGLGVLLAAQPILALTTTLLFIITFYFSRIVSLSSIVATTLMPIIYLFLNPNGEQFIPFAIIAIVITYRHSSNIKRLIEGTEKKFTSRKES
jgi:glycerol-3-phosphate acyltransferase PlsY